MSGLRADQLPRGRRKRTSSAGRPGYRELGGTGRPLADATGAPGGKQVVHDALRAGYGLMIGELLENSLVMDRGGR